mmetsp:Transcript_15832/g.55079  ORF Transcript_15832/g.55079 Transcript_15832/m.55079 type:complete len:241 (+) Transcript_15832:2477-3199(+)
MCADTTSSTTSSTKNSRPSSSSTSPGSTSSFATANAAAARTRISHPVAIIAVVHFASLRAPTLRRIALRPGRKAHSGGHSLRILGLALAPPFRNPLATRIRVACLDALLPKLAVDSPVQRTDCRVRHLPPVTTFQLAFVIVRHLKGEIRRLGAVFVWGLADESEARGEERFLHLVAPPIGQGLKRGLEARSVGYDAPHSVTTLLYGGRELDRRLGGHGACHGRFGGISGTRGAQPTAARA